MKALATFAASLGILSISACVSAAPDGAQTETDADRSSWALGRYELVLFHGQSLPADLPEGRTLTGGYLILRGAKGGGGPVSFEIHLADPDPKWWRRSHNPGFLTVTGAVWAYREPVEGVRNTLHFEAQIHNDPESWSWFYSFEDFPLEWSDPRFAAGTLLGNELRVGHGEKSLVFLRP